MEKPIGLINPSQNDLEWKERPAAAIVSVKVNNCNDFRYRTTMEATKTSGEKWIVHLKIP